MGINIPKTRKLMGMLNEAPMVVMVDSGATHCFISTNLVERLGVLDSLKNVWSLLGDGGGRTR